MKLLRPLLLCVFCIFLFAIVFVILTRTHTALAAEVHAQSGDTAARPAIQPDLQADTRTDPKALDKYAAAIREMFRNDNFEQIESIARSARESKERFSGGFWKLSDVYAALEYPPGGYNVDDAQWQEHFAHLERWQSLMPEAIAPRIVLAGSYLYFAEKARGSGFSNEVLDEGWRLYAERTAHARKLLDDAAPLAKHDPLYYFLMLTVAQHEGWPADKEKALFEEAIAAEPAFWPNYRQHAQYLRVEWFGKPGDIRRMADEMYTRLGPVEGPITYFEIATHTSCNCGDDRTVKFSLARVKEGFLLENQHYGESITHLNQLGFVEWLSEDPVGLEDTFARIGNNYDPGGWQDPDNIQRAHQWLDGQGANGPHTEPLREEMTTTTGQNFAKLIQSDFDARYAKLLSDCRVTAGDDLRGFYFIFKQDQTGKLTTAFSYPPTALNACFSQAAMRERPTLLAPPSPDYWSRIVVKDR